MPIRLRKSETLTSLNLTPLIDVVFNVLVFFLVAARFADDERRMDVMLPSAAQTRPMISEFRELVININREGKIFLGNEPVNRGATGREVASGAGDQPFQQSVLIRADRQCSWEAVIAAMDACHAVGLGQFIL